MDRAGRYLLREYGSWGVMTISFLAGMLTGKYLTVSALPAFLSLCLLINSKQALTIFRRSKGEGALVAGIIFTAQVLIALPLLAFLLSKVLFLFLPFGVIPLAYLFFLRSKGEHSLLTEITGFSLLSMASLVSRYLSSGTVDLRFFLAVAVFFVAGVFKVKTYLRKRMRERLIMTCYICLALIIYHSIDISVVLLLPLLDNLFYAAFLYRVKLRTAGWLEMAKGVTFMLLAAVTRT